MTLLYDHTQLLLTIDPTADDCTLDAALESLSGTVVTQLALQAKAIAYRARVDRGLAAAANQGASLDELAAAAGMDPDEVIARLQTTPRGLVQPATRVRLGLKTASSAASSRHAGPAPDRADDKTWAWPSLRPR